MNGLQRLTINVLVLCILLSALFMLFRGGVDAIMMRAQLAVPDNTVSRCTAL